MCGIIPAIFILPGNNQLFNISLKPPAWLRICGARLTLPLSAADLCSYAEEKTKHYLFCICLIRDLSQMCPCVALGSSPCCRCGCLYALCVSDIGRKLLGLFMWRSDVCRVWEIFPSPFWEALTLSGRGTVPQVQRRPPTVARVDWHWPRSMQSVFIPLFHACVVVESRKCGQFRFHPWGVEHFHFPSLQARLQQGSEMWKLVWTISLLALCC